MADFKLDIVEQHWIDPEPNGISPDGSVDACTHGSIRAEISGVKVTTDEGDYGIVQSALQLLRSLELDRTNASKAEKSFPLEGGFLLCHSCGYPLSFGCTNFGTDWLVRHEGSDVWLSQFLTIGLGVPRGEPVRVPLVEYRREIVQFAREARRFYMSSGPRQVEDWEVDLHERFWAEFDSRLNNAEQLAGGS